MQSESCDCKYRSKLLLNTGILFLFCIILLVTYLPVVQTDYYFMEDYIFVRGSEVLTYNESFRDEIVVRTSDGKTIYGAFLYLIASLNVSGNAIRLLGIISLGLLAYIIYKFFITYRIKSEHSFLISIIVCTLPAFQIYVAWTVAVPYIFSATLSVIAGILLFKLVSEKDIRSSIYQAGLFFSIIAILVIAMYIYAPTAMLYWALGIVPLSILNNDDFTKKWRKKFIIFISAGFISLVIYFLSVKLLHFILNIGFVGRGGLIEWTNIPLKLKWFFFCPLTYALNLWNIYPTYKLASIVTIIILGMFLLKVIKVPNKEKRAHVIWNHCLRLFLTAGFIFLSFLPNLMITDTNAPYRTLASLTMIVFFLFYFGLVSIFNFIKIKPGFLSNLQGKAVTIALILLTLVATYHAHNNVKNFAMLQAKEFEYVKSAISDFVISEASVISEIFMRRTDTDKIIERGVLYIDEFSTTAHPWGPPNVIRRALIELGINANIKIAQGAYDVPIPRGENILAIDMTKFDYLSNYNNSITKTQKHCRTFPDRL